MAAPNDNARQGARTQQSSDLAALFRAAATVGHIAATVGATVAEAASEREVPSRVWGCDLLRIDENARAL